MSRAILILYCKIFEEQ